MPLNHQPPYQFITRSRERSAASPIFDEMAKNARALPPTLEGIQKVASIETTQLFSLLSPKIEAEFSDEWKKLLANKEARAIEDELTVALSFPRNGSGLEFGGAWLFDFKKKWVDYQKNQHFDTAFKRFFSDRKARLRESLPEFKAAVGNLESEAKIKLRDKYLMLKEDESDPIALEYDLAVAGI